MFTLYMKWQHIQKSYVSGITERCIQQEFRMGVIKFIFAALMYVAMARGKDRVCKWPLALRERGQ